MPGEAATVIENRAQDEDLVHGIEPAVQKELLARPLTASRSGRERYARLMPLGSTQEQA